MTSREHGASPGSMDPRVVLMTAPSREVGLELAHALVSERLVACVNIADGVTSVYIWEGSIEQADEVLMVAKTVSWCVPKLESRLLELHPFDVPEFVVLKPEHVEARFAEWLLGASPPPVHPGDRT